MTRRTTGVWVTIAVLAAMLGVLTPASAAAVKAKETGVRYTAKTVKVPRAIVRRNLIGISADGIFKFKRAAGPLARLKVDSVMLLEGSAAGTVTALITEHGQLIVVTRDAPLAAIVSSGSISFSGVPE